MGRWFPFLILASRWLRAVGATADSIVPEAPAVGPGEELSGGATTVFDDTRNAYSLAAGNLSDEHRAAFFVGNSFFNQNWVAAPSSTKARDGLGPLFNARSCSACHFKDGRSRPPDDQQPMSTMLLRISVPGRGAMAGRGRTKPTVTKSRDSARAAFPPKPMCWCVTNRARDISAMEKHSRCASPFSR